jgi:hypothetical protein
MNGRKGRKDGRYGNPHLQAVLEGRVQRGHATGCKHATKLCSDTVGMERCVRNNNLHTVMIIPRDRTREMSEFWILEFAEIERTIEKNEWSMYKRQYRMSRKLWTNAASTPVVKAYNGIG